MLGPHAFLSVAMSTSWGGDGTHLPLAGNSPNMGFVIALQDSSANPSNTTYISGASDKSGGASLVQNTLDTEHATGETYSDTLSNPVNYAAWHPYGNGSRRQDAAPEWDEH